MKLLRRKVLIYFLVVLFVISEFYPSLVWAQVGKVKVGFIGFKFEGVGEGVKRDITNSILYSIARKRSVEIVSPEEAISIVGSEKINSVLSYPTESEIALLTTLLGVDYLFFGSFVNQGRDTNDVFLLGRFECFDRPKRKFHAVEIAWRYENIDKEVQKIDKEFISKVLPSGGKMMVNLFFILTLLLIVVGTYTLIWELGGASSEGMDQPPVVQ